ncbi:MAG: hypothetical protein HN348_02160, partial [Proteobacteria bacterium]|nr:hypothetical protein [Pseudomonadota bacterium]
MDRRRIGVPLAIVCGLLVVGASVEIVGQLNGKSVIGRAAGMGEGSGGCEGPVGEPIELPADIIVVEPT